MKKTINYCGNCPFCQVDYDEWAVGASTIEKCGLSMFLKQDYIIDVYNGDDNKGLVSPDWCPLKKEEFTFEFNNFSDKRLEDINNVTSKIVEIEDYLQEKEYYHTDFKNSEYSEKEEELTQLYIEYDKLQNNEEPDVDQDFQEVSDAITQIKEQLSVLEETSYKLQDTFSKLDNYENN